MNKMNKNGAFIGLLVGGSIIIGFAKSWKGAIIFALFLLFIGWAIKSINSTSEKIKKEKGKKLKRKYY